LLSLAILFVRTGHLLEPTTGSRELYFEHRNYLPAVFLFVPVAAGLLTLQNRIKLALIAFIAVAISGSYAMATWQAASLWGNEAQLMLVWAEANPRSPRAQTSAAQTWMRMGHPERAFALLEHASRQMPDSALLTASNLSVKAELGALSLSEFTEGAERLRRQPFDGQMRNALKHLVERINARAPLPEHAAVMMSLLARIRDDLQSRIPLADAYTYYLQGELLSGQDDGAAAYHYLKRALSHYGDVDTGLYIVSMLATNGHFKEALDILEQSKHVLDTQADRVLRRRRSAYEREITRLRITLTEDIVNNSDQGLDMPAGTIPKWLNHVAGPFQGPS
jgi:tetratricopeptide (TPR) repeat protein